MNKNVFAVAVAFAFTTAPASATLFAGNTVGADYIFPDQQSTYDTHSFVAPGSTQEVNIFTLGIDDNTVTANQFTFDSHFNQTSFNGFHVYDYNGTIADITGVSIDAATNMVGFDASHISFDADNIYVNWGGLSFDQNTIVKLDVQSSSAVPEPASWAMMLGGFGFIGRALRSRKRTSVSFA